MQVKFDLSPGRMSTAPRAVVAASRAGLVLFHLFLLWHRFADASISRPGVLARWGGAAALVAGALLFQRFTRNRRLSFHAIVVFWLTAALLHVGIPPSDAHRDLDPEVIAVVQLAIVVPAVLLAATTLTPSPNDRLRAAALLSTLAFGHLNPALATRIASRAPPSR